MRKSIKDIKDIKGFYISYVFYIFYIFYNHGGQILPGAIYLGWQGVVGYSLLEGPRSDPAQLEGNCWYPCRAIPGAVPRGAAFSGSRQKNWMRKVNK